MKVVGVDGCPSGWVAVTLDDSGWACEVHPTIEALWAAHSDAARVWVDMPIGLPDTSLRDTEAACRAVLGPRRSSVFSTSPRPVIYAPDYPTAKALSRQLTGKGMSTQSWCITPKIRAVDTFLGQNPAARPVMVESHPEVVFWALNGGQPMAHGKKVKQIGQTERMTVLKCWYPAADDVLAYAKSEFRRKQVGLDDIVDALCLAIGARFERFASLPPSPSQDSYGLPMQVVYPVIPTETL